MKSRAEKKNRPGIRRRLLGALLALLVVICALPSVALADSYEVRVPVSITGGGTAKIEGTDYVPRADEEQEAFADGWEKKNGSALMPETPTLDVADGETGEFVWNLDLEAVKPGEMYSYKITQVPGDDRWVIYDDAEYLLEIFIEYDELGMQKRVYVQLRQTDVDRDHKPTECSFENENIPLAPPTPIHDETWGKRGEKQTGTPTFEEGSSKIVTIQLIDPETGEPTDEKTVIARDKNGKTIGTYTLNEDKTVTFTPDPDFVGDPEPCRVKGTDENGLSAVAVYTPHVTDTPAPPPTGDAARPLLYVGLLAVSGLLLFFVVLAKRRRKDEEE